MQKQYDSASFNCVLQVNNRHVDKLINFSVEIVELQ